MSWINYNSALFIKNQILNNRYRIFKKLINLNPPYSLYNNKKIINWSNNDYNGLVKNKELQSSLIEGINNFGCGSSGTRNIGGTHDIHEVLESKICKLHNKQMGLIFNSGYLSNLSTMQALGTIFPNGEFYSDEYNHNSLIYGMKLSKLKKNIFKHNDIDNLEYLLKKGEENKKQKIIVLESMYSIDGSIPFFDDIIYLKKKYDAMIFLDEIHAVGVHGNKGGGISDLYNLTNDIDLIMGGFGKGYGLFGGYITGSNFLIDAIRLCGAGFIFTTSLPPHIIYGIMKSIDYNKKNIKHTQEKRKKLVQFFKKTAVEKNIPVIDNNFSESQIQSIIINDASKAEILHDLLLNKYNHYVQHLNYPTVSIGNERLRISIKSHHTEQMIIDLLDKTNKILKIL